MHTDPHLVPLKPVYAILDEAVAAAPDEKALDFLDKSWTYAELGSLVERAAAGFRVLGVKAGIHVGLHLPNTPYYVICYFAILKAGGTVVNYNPLYVEHELSYQITDSQTAIMVTMDLVQTYAKLAPFLGTAGLKKLVVCPMAEILPTGKKLAFRLFKSHSTISLPRDARIIGFEYLIKLAAPEKPPPINCKTAIAVLQYTGGTTGVPKGAILTHGNISANVAQISALMHMFDAGCDRMLCVLPFFHAFGMTVAMLLAIARRAQLILLPRFEIDQVLKVITQKRPTLLPGVPTIYVALNRAMAKPNTNFDLRSIRACISGGAPLPKSVRQDFERTCGCKLVEGYGLSEASPVVTCNPFDRPCPEGSVGLALPGTDIELRALDDPTQCVNPGTRGEICIRGPQVMAGYWQKPEDTKSVFVGDFLRTGDIGYVDDKGFIYIVDRIKDMIMCSGYKVYPHMIEKAINLHPAVEEVIVLGVADSYRGQSPKAYVKLKQDAVLTPAELQQFLVGHLSAIEMPQAIEFRSDLPRTAVGKLSKKALAEEESAKRSKPDHAS